MTDLSDDERAALNAVLAGWDVVDDQDTFSAEAIWRAAGRYHREQSARELEMTDSAIRLMAGEMTAQEMRTVKAILKNRAIAIRKRIEGTTA